MSDPIASERQSNRDAVDRFTGRLVRSGMDPRKAEQVARDTAKRKDYADDRKR